MSPVVVKTLQKPEAILFDWDNTLIDSWAIIFDALNFTLKTFDKDPWTMYQVRERVRKSLRDSFPGLFGDDWQKAADVFYARFEDIHISMICPFEGAEEMLSELSGRGIYLGVVSNKRGQYLRKEASHLGWDRHFAKLVGATDVSNDKPATDPVELALSGTPHKRGGQVWFVGDADIDMECAFNAELAPVLLRPEAPEPKEFNEFKPLCHLENCQALSKLVGNM
ncbi:MAG: HAD hydrolase-like protein [Rhodospirillales bacterium]|nr:HAD hydrolase-like protein [Rhodospirillales bacterium]